MRLRTFVAQPIPEAALRRLEGLGEVEVFPHVDRDITREELLAAVPGRDVLVVLGRVRCDREVLAAADGLALVATMASTPRNVDVEAATEHGVAVTTIPSLTSISVAELAMALVTALSWRLPEAQRFVAEGRWQQRQSMAFMTTQLAGQRLGLFGLGRIGQAVARRARAFAMDVAYHKRTPLPEHEELELGVRWCGLDELFASSDVLVLAAPLTPQSEGLVDADRLATMRRTALLVNVARGGLVVEDDLVAALHAGEIAGAGLDVVADEPRPHPGLLALPNVILTPHIGSASQQTRERMADAIVDEVEAFAAGRRPAHLVNPEAGN